MAEYRLRLLLTYLVILTIAVLVLVSGMGGCKKTAVKGEENGGETDGQDGNDGHSATGPSGIAFIRDDHVLLAKADGSGERKLTSSAAGYGDLAFSPSGGKLAATKVEGDAFPQLVVIDVASGNLTDVSWTNPDFSAAWAAAGVEPWFGGISWVREDALYCTGMKNQGGQIVLQVLKCDLPSRKIEVIEGDAKSPAVSPDGKKLAYIRKPADWAQAQGGPWDAGDFGDLIVRDLGSGNSSMLNFNVFDAVFSPDGVHMAVTVFDEPDTALILTGLDGKRQHTLKVVGPSGTIRHPSFSPGGDEVVAYHGWREIPGEPYTYIVFTVPVNQDNPPGSDLGKGKDPAWSPSL